MNDSRSILKNGAELLLDCGHFIIRDPIGYGGSCVAYSAELLPNKYEESIGMPIIPAVIKEFYPLELLGEIKRISGELIPDNPNIYERLKCNFEFGTTKQAEYSVNHFNHALPAPKISSANNTAFSVVTAVQGVVLSENRESLSPFDKADIMTSLCNAVSKLHIEKKLHLDIKPSNIFIFNKEQDEERRVALFDFDSVTLFEDIRSAIVPYSPCWSPYEQENKQIAAINYATDVYSIGAVIYWLYCGEKPTKQTLDSIERKRFGFMSELGFPSDKYLQEHLQGILYSTLRRDSSKRVNTAKDIPI